MHLIYCNNISALQAARRGDRFADSCSQLERRGYSQEEVVMALVILGSADAEADSRVSNPHRPAPLLLPNLSTIIQDLPACIDAFLTGQLQQAAC